MVSINVSNYVDKLVYIRQDAFRFPAIVGTPHIRVPFSHSEAPDNLDSLHPVSAQHNFHVVNPSTPKL